MATVTVTANLQDVGGFPDNTTFTFYSPQVRSGVDESIVTGKRVRVSPVAGVLTVDLEPGPCIVSWTGSQPLSIEVPDSDSGLWPLIQVAIGVPPSTPQSTLISAVEAYLSSSASPMGVQLLTADDAEGARGVLDFRPTVNIITSGVNVERESTGVDWTDGAEVRSTLQGIISQATSDNQRVRFPNREYLLGVTGAVGANRLSIPAGAKLEFDSGSFFVVNQLDSGGAVVGAFGTESAKTNMTSDAAAGDRVITLPTGRGATFSVGDLIGIECATAVTPNVTGVTGIGNARQILMVEEVAGDVIRTDRTLRFTFTTSAGAQFWKIAPVKDIVVDGMKFLSGAGVTPGTDAARLLRFQRTLNTRVANIEFHDSIGGLYFTDAYDSYVDGVYGNRLPRKNDFGGYVFAAEGSTTNLIVNGLRGRENRHLFTTLFDTRSVTGQAQAGGSATITLASSASNVNGFYVGGSVYLSAGTGSAPPQVRTITGYVGSTRVATVDSAWTVQPDATSVYALSTSWGGPEQVNVNGAIGFAGLAGSAVFDTHEAGWDINFNDCIAYGGADVSEASGAFAGLSQSGAQIRSSDTHLNNFRAIRMGRTGVNFTTQSRNGSWDGGEAAYCRAQGLVNKGIGNKVRNVDIHDNLGAGVYFDANTVDAELDNARIANNTLYGVSDFGSTRTRITGGRIPKSAAQTISIYGLSATSSAVAVECLGYGAATTGMGSTVSGAQFDIKTDTDRVGNISLNSLALSGPVLTNPLVSGDIKDVNGNAIVKMLPTASAVNCFRVANRAAAGGNPTLESFGTDANLGMTFTMKGTGALQVFQPSGDLRIQASGTPTDVSIDIQPKGAGVVKAGGAQVYASGGADVSLADGGTGASLADPNADRIMFWDDSAGAMTWLTLGTNLAITGTTIDASGSGGGGGTGDATATASTLAQRDGNANLRADAFVPTAASTATAAGTTTLTVDSAEVQLFTGGSTQTVVLPTTNVVAGQRYTIINQSSGSLTLQTSNATTIVTLLSGQSVVATSLQATPTTSAHWVLSAGSPNAFRATASASSVALRDAQANLIADNFISTATSIATAAGTTTLAVDSSQVQVFTGTTTQTVLLPTTSIAAGQSYTLVNNSTGIVTVQSSGANVVGTVAPSTTNIFVAQVATPTTAAHWQVVPTITGAQRIAVVTTIPGSPDPNTVYIVNDAGAPRVTTITSSATPAINTDACDAVTITALAAAITSMTTSLTGTPHNFQKLMIRIKDNGTARAIAWGASFEAGTVALPTTTVAGKPLLVGLVYDAVDAKWACEATGSRA